MFKIEKNAAWEKFEKLLNEDILDRYNWFLFEFGKRITGRILEELLGKLKNVKGTKDYQKRLAIAEIRDKNHRVWWAIAAKVKTLGQSDHDPKKSILEVVPRYALDEENPINEILVNFGPWTAETLPFVPSLRQAVVVMHRSTEAKTKQVRQKNFTEGRAITSFMRKHEIEFDPRFMVYQRLKVFPDLEIEALRIEYGMSENGKAHWRPTLAWARRTAASAMQADSSLIKAMTDPNFKGYKVRKHTNEYMTLSEVKALSAFQNKIRKDSR